MVDVLEEKERKDSVDSSGTVEDEKPMGVHDNASVASGGSDRRAVLRKIAAALAVAGVSGLALGRLPELVSASNSVPPSGTATFDGPVGIGTTSPNELLHVYGGSGNIGMRFENGSNTASDYLAQRYMMGGSEKAVVFTHLNDMTFRVLAGNLILNDAGGNVGIGTTSPGQKLTVAGDVGQSVSANGMVKAAVLVNGSGSIIRSFNNLPGGSGPTVTQPLGPGTYEVNFGANVAQRFFSATLLSSNSTDPGGASDGQALVSTRDGNANAVFVRTNDSTGTSTNRSFYLMVF